MWLRSGLRSSTLRPRARCRTAYPPWLRARDGTPLVLFEAFLRACPPEHISAGYASWDFDRATHAIADTWALDPERLRATLALWREHKLIATDGPDTFRKRLRI